MEQFDLIKKTIEGGLNLRPAQLLCRELDVCSYEEFVGCINSAISKCSRDEEDPSLHFTEIDGDYELTQYACYLIISNLKFPKEEFKKEVKSYFYTKNFDGWNNEKQKINSGIYEPTDNVKYINKMEIRNCKFGINIGNEADGKGKYLRPVLVIERIGNLYLIAPLTKNGKDAPDPASGYYHKINSVDFGFPSYVMLSQIKVIDKKRCIRKLAKINSAESDIIKNLLKNMYFPEDSS